MDHEAAVRVKFTDKTSYNAEAVKFNWEYLITKKALASAAFGALAGLRVVDDLTLEIQLKAPNSMFPLLLGTQCAVHRLPHGPRGARRGFGTNPVGAGPFIMEQWVRGSEMVLVRNPDYWNAPQPYLERLVIRYIPEHQQRVNSLIAGRSTWGKAAPRRQRC